MSVMETDLKIKDIQNMLGVSEDYLPNSKEAADYKKRRVAAETDLKIKNILNKLNKLNCPFVGNDKVALLTEILFKPSSERYKVIEWSLEKLQMNVHEAFEHQSSLESKIQNLLVILSSLGVCGAGDTDVLEGTASQRKQLAFWEQLSSILLKKAQLTNANTESCSRRNAQDMPKQYEYNCDYVDKVLKSINFHHLFDKELQLFPSYLKKEMKTCLQQNASLSVEDIKKSLSVNLGVQEVDETVAYRIGEKTFQVDESVDNEIPDENILNEVEDNISVSLYNLQKFSTNSFNDAYDSLKLYLSNVSPKEFTDIGPAFKVAEGKLQSVLQLKNSSTLLKSSDTELQVISSDISNFQMSPRNLSDTKLGEYVTILSELKEK